MKLILLLFLTTLSGFSFTQTFTGGAGPINDYQTTNIPLTISGLPTIMDTTNFGLSAVCFTINHTYVSDLTVSVVAPDGTVAQLFSGVGGAGQAAVANWRHSAAAHLWPGTPQAGHWWPPGARPSGSCRCGWAHSPTPDQPGARAQPPPFMLRRVATEEGDTRFR